MSKTLAMAALAVALSVCLSTAVLAGELEHLGIQVELRAGTALADLVGPSRREQAPARPGDALPDGRPGLGSGQIREAWLVGPTTRYGHGVLGDGVEAGGLRIVLADGRSLQFDLEPDSVFEDLRPRLADLDGDGLEEILVVRSYLDRGAALTVFGLADGALVRRAETPAIGLSHRWLNPVGAGDLDGDGRPEIAYVETPHIGGILRIWRLEGGRLVELARAEGFSNHAIGSRALGPSAILDLDGDGADDLLIPSASRRALRVMSFAGGRLRELGDVRHPAPIASNFAVRDLDGNGRRDVAYDLADGTLVVLYR
jgi:hypothetical protein